ncbi:uncharacterized protein [Elaeis guineensis]|uniref:uncharacterized protein isoform X2 n=1 Tax=Elaeis guineensis var. tenera TaxID=51953 RepID=UPI003C6D5DD9
MEAWIKLRLAKRWVSSHLFSSFLAEEAIELVVAYLFLKPFPFHAPCSRITGFLRFLRLLSNYDWIFSPLIVDINNDFTSKDEKEINENFMLSRKSYEENAQDVETAMFLATSYDKASEAWTKFSPNRLCLFRTPLNNYDAVVLLHRDKLSYPRSLLFPAEINNGKHVIWGRASKGFHPYMSLGGALKSLEDARNKLMVNFDPVRYLLEDLKKRGRDEGDEIRRDPTDILREVGEVGKGFVKSVYLLKAPRFHS